MQLPNMKGWPNKGYSFCTWLRIESFADPLGKPKYEPRLFSFLSTEGIGIEAFFSGTVLFQELLYSLHLTGNILHTHIIYPNGKLVHGFSTFPFEPRRWYFLTLVHAKARLAQVHNTSIHPLDVYNQQSELRLFIDGKLQEKLPFKYPQFGDSVVS